ncbi:unnamed protein product [Protopolystoma xenopodis]|uniref:Uncharacterized protein n=1 Tax=Protopolystoma xenopodis TaxID=117903 RepID=A0A3S5B7H1_9PLAT|nr:unnamed protein product [Protopolystoma xenopodis]
MLRRTRLVDYCRVAVNGHVELATSSVQLYHMHLAVVEDLSRAADRSVALTVQRKIQLAFALQGSQHSDLKGRQEERGTSHG